MGYPPPSGRVPPRAHAHVSTSSCVQPRARVLDIARVAIHIHSCNQRCEVLARGARMLHCRGQGHSTVRNSCNTNGRMVYMRACHYLIAIQFGESYCTWHGNCIACRAVGESGAQRQQAPRRDNRITKRQSREPRTGCNTPSDDRVSSGLRREPLREVPFPGREVPPTFVASAS
jgi:hypothetical protein